ncbi:hypothetical protein F0562_017415 [Nyssa sinensis]|uniref:Uncharacterized protein n=1 Tax=Nyssa sinensis TaxID=561372 RepID=A0A5J4ZHZ5_9ASTE|nr:hypothetical protein F0562_017415 [Nyssa sinensis]
MIDYTYENHHGQVLKVLEDIVELLTNDMLLNGTLDICKRRLQRSTAKDVVDVEKPFHIPIQDKSGKCKFHPLKLFLVIITFGTFVTLLNSSTVCQNDHTAHSLSSGTTAVTIVKPGMAGITAPSIGDLRSGSPKLVELNDFIRHLQKKGLLEVLSFCETKVTPIVEGYGGWAFRMEIVPIESAYPGFGELVASGPMYNLQWPIALYLLLGMLGLVLLYILPGIVSNLTAVICYNPISLYFIIEP